MHSKQKTSKASRKQQKQAKANAHQAKLRIVYVCFSPIRLALRILAVGMPAKQSKAKRSKAKQSKAKPNQAKQSKAKPSFASFYVCFSLCILPSIFSSELTCFRNQSNSKANKAKQSEPNQACSVVKSTCLVS